MIHLQFHQYTELGVFETGSSSQQAIIAQHIGCKPSIGETSSHTGSGFLKVEKG